jgi:isoamylase
LLVIMNAHHDVVQFTLPKVSDGKHWINLIDTNTPKRTDAPAFEFGQGYVVTGRSLLVFVLGLQDQQQTRKLREGIAAILDIAERPVESDIV